MCDQQSEPWTQHQTLTSSCTPIGQDAQQPGSQHRVSSSSSWDQQSTSAAAHKQQLHLAVQKQSYMPSTPEQQNHFTSETSYKKRSMPRRWTLGSTQTLRSGRAWQQGLDPQRKQSTSDPNTIQHLFIQQLVQHDLVRVIKINTAKKHRGHLHQVCGHRDALEASQRCWAHNPALLATAATNNSFTAPYALPCERVYTVRATCAAYTHRHTSHSHGADNGQQHRL